MASTAVDTLIVGGGIAGLACARHLHTCGKQFLLISPDIGGRILSSADRAVNYGAFFVCDDYHHMLKFTSHRRRIRLSDFCFHEKTHSYVLYQPKLLSYIMQFLKIKTLLRSFRSSLGEMRKSCVSISQKTAIEQDPLLYEAYMTDATDYVTAHQLERGTQTYLSKALYSTTFSSIDAMNAFSFLQFLLPLITPIYTFQFEQEKMIAPFQESIRIDSVHSIHYRNKQYHIKTDSASYTATNLVLATEVGWSAPFAHISSMNTPISTHMLHIRGTPKKSFQKKAYHLFHPGSEVQAVADCLNGTYLLYYKDHEPDITIYFYDPEIIASKYWNPAGRINGHVLIEAVRGNNCYCIGDYNIAGLEETYITGIFAANQIMKKKEE